MLSPAALAIIVYATTATLPCRAGDPAPAAARAATISWNADAARFEVTGLQAESLASLRESPLDAKAWSQRFAVHVTNAGNPAAAPLFGAYALVGDAVTFQPRFPLRPGLTYRATFNLVGKLDDDGEDAIDAVVEIPALPSSLPATVEVVYPSSDKLPENLLKFYIHFSAPMSRGEAYSRLHIVDVTDPAAPREVPDAFLRLGEELWDASGKRFTLLFDPGRIKRGLKPNMEEGAPLVAGRRYALLIDQAWRDAQGRPLAQGLRKEFLITPFDDGQPDPEDWRFAYPDAGTTDALVVSLPEPLDHALLEHAITVEDPSGRAVDGKIMIVENEVTWALVPDRPWPAGDYQLAIDPILEDLAGNSVGRAFETRAQTIVDEGTKSAAVTLPFRITPP
jgi:hypothetical protein